MALTLNLLDIRGLSPEETALELKMNLANIDKQRYLWLINDCEPVNIYRYLLKNGYCYETYIVTRHEYRICICKKTAF